MKILLKILVAPFALALSLLAALLVFLFDILSLSEIVNAAPDHSKVISTDLSLVTSSHFFSSVCSR